VIAARGGGDAGRRRPAHEQVGERPPGLERAGVLAELELEGEGGGAGQAEVGGVHSDDGRGADVRPDQPVGGLDALARDAGRRVGACGGGGGRARIGGHGLTSY
jgi:hypothetical protein